MHLPWYEAGILDADAASEVIESLGADTFASGALEMAAVDEGYASVPVDGWTQMIVYRADLFEENGLEPPTTYANVLAAVEALHNPPEMFGFVAATKVDENFMSQVLEHVFLANGVSPVGPDGFQPLEVGPTTEVLEFYRAIVEASPEGELFWQQSRELYFAGRAAMIIWSPFILDELAGLRDSAPPTINDDPTSRDLAERTGIVTNFAGPSNPDGAAWADIRYFGDHGRCGYRGGAVLRRVFHVGRLHRDAGHRARGQVPGAPRRRREPHRLYRGLGAARRGRGSPRAAG
jgi:multiple sugar transport system substrate-binding protein